MMSSKIHPRGRPSNDELLQRGAREVLGWLERVETQHLHLVVEYNAKMREMARAVEQQRQEIAQLKERNSKSQIENEELRNMCCFLDDERERAHKLVAEWRRFGRYTAAILSHELNSYRDKLGQLESRQSHILSSSGFKSEQTSAKPDLLEATPSRERLKSEAEKEDNSSDNSASSATQNRPPLPSTEPPSMSESDTSVPSSQQGGQQRRSIADNVADAFKVLEVHEQLDSDPMSDREKALIRDMCNVVWNKLEQHYTPSIQQVTATEEGCRNATSSADVIDAPTPSTAPTHN